MTLVQIILNGVDISSKKADPSPFGDGAGCGTGPGTGSGLGGAGSGPGAGLGGGTGFGDRHEPELEVIVGPEVLELLDTGSHRRCKQDPQDQPGGPGMDPGKVEQGKFPSLILFR